jgi:hypothetical protein
MYSSQNVLELYLVKGLSKSLLTQVLFLEGRSTTCFCGVFCIPAVRGLICLPGACRGRICLLKLRKFVTPNGLKNLFTNMYSSQKVSKLNLVKGLYTKKSFKPVFIN